jgi:hypothetical protein
MKRGNRLSVTDKCRIITTTTTIIIRGVSGDCLFCAIAICDVCVGVCVCDKCVCVCDKVCVCDNVYMCVCVRVCALAIPVMKQCDIVLTLCSARMEGGGAM